MKKIIKTAIASLLTGVIAVSSVSSAAAAQNNADPAGRPGFIDNVSPGYYSAEENRNILPSLVIVVGFDDESDPLPYKDNYDWNKVFLAVSSLSPIRASKALSPVRTDKTIKIISPTWKNCTSRPPNTKSGIQSRSIMRRSPMVSSPLCR